VANINDSIGKYVEYSVANNLTPNQNFVTEIQKHKTIISQTSPNYNFSILDDNSKNISDKILNYIQTKRGGSNIINLIMTGQNYNFKLINSFFDNTNPSDILLELNLQNQFQKYLGVSIKNLIGPSRSVKINPGIDGLLTHLGSSRDSLYRNIVPNIISKYSLPSLKKGKKWYLKTDVIQDIAKFKQAANDVKSSYRDEIYSLLNTKITQDQDGFKDYIIEDILRLINIPFYIVVTNRREPYEPMQNDYVNAILSSTISILKKSDFSILINQNGKKLFSIGIKFESSSDMTSSIKLRVT
jgi:hypothetical protein